MQCGHYHNASGLSQQQQQHLQQGIDNSDATRVPAASQRDWTWPQAVTSPAGRLASETRCCRQFSARASPRIARPRVSHPNSDTAYTHRSPSFAPCTQCPRGRNKQTFEQDSEAVRCRLHKRSHSAQAGRRTCKEFDRPAWPWLHLLWLASRCRPGRLPMSTAMHHLQIENPVNIVPAFGTNQRHSCQADATSRRAPRQATPAGALLRMEAAATARVREASGAVSAIKCSRSRALHSSVVDGPPRASVPSHTAGCNGYGTAHVRLQWGGTRGTRQQMQQTSHADSAR